MEALLPLFLILGLFFAIVAALIGSRKGQGGLGFILGLLFGPFGILIMLFTKGSRRECPYCKEIVKQDATVCPHCQREFTGGRATPFQQSASNKALKAELKELGMAPRSNRNKSRRARWTLVLFLGALIVLPAIIAIISGLSDRQAIKTPPKAVHKSKPVISRPDIPVPESQPIYILEILSWHWSRTHSGDYVKIEGEVKNISDRNLRGVEALVSFYTSDGTFITSGDAFVEFNPILPGQKSPFSVMERYNPAMAMARTTLQFKFFAGELILTRWK